jgi:hypothetical protein
MGNEVIQQNARYGYATTLSRGDDRFRETLVRIRMQRLVLHQAAQDQPSKINQARQNRPKTEARRGQQCGSRNRRKSDLHIDGLLPLVRSGGRILCDFNHLPRSVKR